MFTGLVRNVGRLSARRAASDAQTLVIEGALAEPDRAIGASVSVSGVCLTVTHADPGGFSADAAFETLRRTTLGDKPIGARLNLEPALRVGDPLGGHLVSGHVDGVARVRAIVPHGEATEVWIDTPPDLLSYCAQKGSICVDGTSLTINDVDATGFSVGLVPHTRAVTTLGTLAVGDALNLEVDVVARYVARLLSARFGAPAGSSGGLAMSDLVAAGFAGPTEVR